MITLTIPRLVNSVLGGATTVAYDKFVLGVITYDVMNMTARSNIVITSTTEPTMQALDGSLLVNTATAVLTIQVEQLDFYRQITLTGPENAAMQDFIRTAQNSLEAGLISVNVLDGTQAPGA